MQEIMSRGHAKEIGSVRYFTGIPCKNGHVAERLTSNGVCMECARIRSAGIYRAAPEENLRRQKARRDADPYRAREDKRARRRRSDPSLITRDAERRRVAELRASAHANGQRFFNTGTPCANGHLSDRYASDGKCAVCVSETNARKRPKIGKRVKSSEEIKAKAEMKAAAEDRLAIRNATSSARREAIASGAITYFSQRPCPQGHVGDRYTIGGNCVACAAEENARKRESGYFRDRYRKFRDKILLAQKIRYLSSHETRKKRARQSAKWAAANKDKVSMIKKSYKARRRATERCGDSTSDILAWVSGQAKLCYWCGSDCKDRYEVDHYVPLSKGGTHSVGNLVISCPRCNRIKSARSPYEFALTVGRLF